MAKFGIDETLENLAESKMLKKLVLTIKRYWLGDNENMTLHSHSPQLVDNIIGDIARKREQPEAQMKEIVEKVIYKDKIVYQDKIIKEFVEVLPSWAIGLESQYHYFRRLKDFPELQPILLQVNIEQPTAILSFISCSSQWSNVLRVWDKLADHCKQNKNEITVERLEILENALFLYNLSLLHNHAQLRKPSVNDDYDYSLHHQVLGVGGRIQTVLLPALYSASGEKVKPALVITA